MYTIFFREPIRHRRDGRCLWSNTSRHVPKKQKCERPDSNRRTPAGSDLKSDAVGRAWLPSRHYLYAVHPEKVLEEYRDDHPVQCRSETLFPINPLSPDPRPEDLHDTEPPAGHPLIPFAVLVRLSQGPERMADTLTRLLINKHNPAHLLSMMILMG